MSCRSSSLLCFTRRCSRPASRRSSCPSPAVDTAPSPARSTRPTTSAPRSAGSTSICVPDSAVVRDRYDVVVVGGGNAALCAALEASRLGASVIIVEAAPEHLRGGNSRHTRNVRYKHTGPDNFLVGDYEEEEFFQDLLQVTGGETDEALARLCINSSVDLGDWI